MLRGLFNQAWNSPAPVRRALGVCARRIGLLSYRTTVNLFLAQRAHYAYCTLKAAELAARLNIPRITIVELGVGQGDGLVNLEQQAQEVERMTGIGIEVYGFDLGCGLPGTSNIRDLPYYWTRGLYRMDEKSLRSRLSRAKLFLGDVKKTIPDFLRSEGFAPIGFISFDLDFYSSTMDAFAICEGPSATRLPRVFVYFDDIVLNEIALVNEHVGELAAIRDFNDTHATLKIGQARYLRNKPLCTFADQIYVLHDFNHAQYKTYIEQPPSG
jgi:hypothetical protein